MGTIKNSQRRQAARRQPRVLPPVGGGGGARQRVPMPDVQAPVSGPATPPRSTPEHLSQFQSTIYKLVDALMAGVTTLEGLAERLNLDASDERTLQELDVLIRLPEVQNSIYAARKDVTAHVVERFKRDAPLFADVVKSLALDKLQSAKIRLAAAQDGLNRAGTGATQKVSLDSPQAYAARLKDLMEPEDKEEKK